MGTLSPVILGDEGDPESLYGGWGGCPVGTLLGLHGLSRVVSPPWSAIRRGSKAKEDLREVPTRVEKSGKMSTPSPEPRRGSQVGSASPGSVLILSPKPNSKQSKRKLFCIRSRNPLNVRPTF